MKKVVLIIIAFFVGVIGTYVTIKLFPGNNDNTIKTVKDVNITESDTIKSSVEKIYDSVYVIKSYQNNNLVGTGTGFVYKEDSENGYMITNHHVIQGATSIKVLNMDGREVEAEILGSDQYIDIAILSIDVSAVMQTASLGDSTNTSVGDTLFAIGSPMGETYKGTVTKGILSGKDRTVAIESENSSFMIEVLQTDTAINPGNSGGPLVNMNGEVIGINSMKLVQDEIEGMGFAIPIEIVKNELDRLEKGEKINRPLLGVSLIDANNTYALYNNNINLSKEYEKGVVVGSVEKNSPAADAKLQIGDVITKINGEEIDEVSHFRFILFKYTVGDTVKVTYERNGKQQEVEIKLTKGIEE